MHNPSRRMSLKNCNHFHEKDSFFLHSSNTNKHIQSNQKDKKKNIFFVFSALRPHRNISMNKTLYNRSLGGIGFFKNYVNSLLGLY